MACKNSIYLLIKACITSVLKNLQTLCMFQCYYHTVNLSHCLILLSLVHYHTIIIFNNIHYMYSIAFLPPYNMSKALHSFITVWCLIITISPIYCTVVILFTTQIFIIVKMRCLNSLHIPILCLLNGYIVISVILFPTKVKSSGFIVLISIYV